MLHVTIRCRFNDHDLTGTVKNFEPRDRLSQGAPVQPAIKGELPQNFRVRLIDPARELNRAAQKDVAVLLTSGEVHRVCCGDRLNRQP
jgi:hypothetical protein